MVLLCDSQTFFQILAFLAKSCLLSGNTLVLINDTFSGGLVVSGGLLGFAFSRNLTSLSTGVLYGGGLLALSTLSLKIWREGKSSFPYILGQAGNLHLLSAGTVGDILLPRLFFISNSLHQVITGILLMISGY